jgi:hypothetical protein
MVLNLQLLVYIANVNWIVHIESCKNNSLWEKAHNEEYTISCAPNLVPHGRTGSGEGRSKAACVLVGWV